MCSSCHSQLWMGSVEPYMNEEFIIAAFRKMGEEPESVRVIRNKYTGGLLGYCFVNFKTDDHATCALHNLNGKDIPGTNPVICFRLNSARHAFQMEGNARKLSVWVGNLSLDVDDCQLYKIFSSKYTSVKQAKVIVDRSGCSKGYGFVRFALEDDRWKALDRMNGYTGLGSKPLRIRNVVFKSKKGILAHFPSNGYATTNYTMYSSVYTHYRDSFGYCGAYSPWQTYDQGQNSWQVYANNYTSYKAYEQESHPWEGYCVPSANCSSETSEGDYYQEKTPSENCSIDTNKAACYQETIPTEQSIADPQQSGISADYSTEQNEEEDYDAEYDEYKDDYNEDVSVDIHKIEMSNENINCDSIEELEILKE